MSRWMLLLLCLGCSGKNGEADSSVPTPKAFLATWEAEVVPKWTAWQQAEWEAHTHVRENDTTWAEKASEARIAWEQEVGKADWLSQARDVYQAAVERAQRTAPDATEEEKARVATEAERRGVDMVRVFARVTNEASVELRTRRDHQVGMQLRTRDQALPKLDGMPIKTGVLEGRYRASADVTERAKLWSATLSGARELKTGFGGLRDTLNSTAKKVGWEDHHQLTVARYDLKPADLALLLRDTEKALRPLYRQLHTWARYELAARYGVVEVPPMLPAHWMDEPLAASWSATFRFNGTDPSAGLAQGGADGLLRDAEAWFTDNQIAGLPGEIWQNSSLYAADENDRFQKTPGASTWDLDVADDIRILMGVTPVEPWLHAAHRELAFAHVLVERQAAGWPKSLRMQPFGVVESALATWVDIASSRSTRLARLGYLDAAQLPDETTLLLEEALVWVPYVVFAAGTAASFEAEVYSAKLPVDRLTSRWWELAAEHQGVVPPETRTERWADPLYLQQLTDAPGRYFEFAVATILAFQIHEKACQEAGVDPRRGDLAAPSTGALFRDLAVRTAGEDWRKVTQDLTGERPSPAAMARHFAPLVEWLQEQNASREITLPKLDGP